MRHNCLERGGKVISDKDVFSDECSLRDTNQRQHRHFSVIVDGLQLADSNLVYGFVFLKSHKNRESNGRGYIISSDLVYFPHTVIHVTT